MKTKALIILILSFTLMGQSCSDGDVDAACDGVAFNFAIPCNPSAEGGGDTEQDDEAETSQDTEATCSTDASNLTVNVCNGELLEVEDNTIGNAQQLTRTVTSYTLQTPNGEVTIAGEGLELQ